MTFSIETRDTAKVPPALGASLMGITHLSGQQGASDGWRQAHANRSPFARTRVASGNAKAAPRGKSGGAVGLELVSVVEPARLVEVGLD